MPSTTFDISLPLAIDDASGSAPAIELISGAEAHIFNLRRQIAYHELRAHLEQDYKQVDAIHIASGEHYNDEGYSPHVALSVRFTDGDGQPQQADSDTEYGNFNEDEHEEAFEGLREFVADLDEAIIAQIEGKWIDCRNPRAMALGVMGAKAFALYEKAAIDRAASGANAAGPGSQRL